MIRRVLDALPAGNPRASLTAADRAQEHRDAGVTDAKVVYNRQLDDFLVITQTDASGRWSAACSWPSSTPPAA